MLSATLISGNSARFWKMRAVGRLLGPMPAMSWPPIRTAPSDGSRNPETVRRMVVLPQPEGPRKEKNSPSSIRSVAPSTAVNWPNLIVTRSSSTSALMPCPIPLARFRRSIIAPPTGTGSAITRAQIVRPKSKQPRLAGAVGNTGRDQADLNLSAYWVRRSPNHDGSGRRCQRFLSASPG